MVVVKGLRHLQKIAYRWHREIQGTLDRKEKCMKVVNSGCAHRMQTTRMERRKNRKRGHPPENRQVDGRWKPMVLSDSILGL